jgi:hypothetical protein
MNSPPPYQPAPPPFCTLASDLLPVAPPPGTPESEALAAWEVLTSARVARSTGSGRMSLLARYQADEVELTTDRLVWIALHPFEGATERWACRLARSSAMSDAEVAAAIVQEMGGPAEEEDEMTTLGFWRGGIGFFFDSRGPRMEITQTRAGEESSGRKRRIGRAALIAAARRQLGIAVGSGTLRGLPPATATHRVATAVEDHPPLQLTLL